MRKVLSLIVALMLVIVISPAASAAELNIFTSPEEPYETITFDSKWFPLREASKYLPFEVDWDNDTKEIVITSESRNILLPFTMERRYGEEWYSDSSDDLTIINGVTYCNAAFLSRHTGGAGFRHKDVVYCVDGVEFDDFIKSAMMEIKVKSPEDYEFITKHLTGGIKYAGYNGVSKDALAYVYPYSQNPICYLTTQKHHGLDLAGSIAHEAYHVYQARNGLAIEETGAEKYERDVIDALRGGGFYYIYKQLN